jgi:antitoxin (DNA-binding transcriptional repressor) of toxin-antitoxin stability system
VQGLVVEEWQAAAGQISLASYHDIPVAGIIGHRQVTDAYLAHLARSSSARLATFDQALATLHADVADLIATC